MDGASSVMAVVATVDLCIEYGNELVQKCNDYRNADQQIRELILRVEDHWLKIEDQMNCVREIWETLDGSLQVHQQTVFSVLKSKLKKSIELISGVIGQPNGENSFIELLRKRGKFRNGRFAWSAKECIEKAVQELDEWHRMFDPSWFLIKLNSNRRIDERLARFQKPVTSPVSVLKSMRDNTRNGIHSAGRSVFISDTFVCEKRKISYSDAYVAQEVLSRSAVIVDTMVCRSGVDASTAIKDVRDLARELSKTDPLSFNLLGCRGVIKHDAAHTKKDDDATTLALTFEFIFAFPQGFIRPQSLRDAILHRRNPPFLDEKIELAKQIANSVAFIHSLNFVHKNIRPETILVFEQVISGRTASFLVGFDTFRMAEGRSYSYGDSNWEKNLYRHPLRQGLLPKAYYSMQHDIYALGVCLLEIGLWNSFVLMHEEESRPQPGTGIDLSDAITIADELPRAREVKKILLAAAEDKLPIAVGSKYSSVVVSCLMCLDDDGSEFHDEDGVKLGVRYIDRVLMQLQQIAVAV